jgi:hypothetical protein
MASYGTFIAACGFEYHGPKGYMRFAPRMGAENFKAPFTAAEGWGTYIQQKNKQGTNATVTVAHGKLSLNVFSLQSSKKVGKVLVKMGEKKIPATFKQEGDNCLIQFKKTVLVSADQSLHISI